MLRVKVWWFVIVVEHPDDDPEEDRYRRHGSILPTSAVSRWGIDSVGIASRSAAGASNANPDPLGCVVRQSCVHHFLWSRITFGASPSAGRACSGRRKNAGATFQRRPLSVRTVTVFLL